MGSKSATGWVWATGTWAASGDLLQVGLEEAEAFLDRHFDQPHRTAAAVFDDRRPLVSADVADPIAVVAKHGDEIGLPVNQGEPEREPGGNRVGLPDLRPGTSRVIQRSLGRVRSPPRKRS